VNNILSSLPDALLLHGIDDPGEKFHGIALLLGIRCGEPGSFDGLDDVMNAADRCIDTGLGGGVNPIGLAELRQRTLQAIRRSAGMGRDKVDEDWRV
jgi:hypothetical protein